MVEHGRLRTESGHDLSTSCQRRVLGDDITGLELRAWQVRYLRVFRFTALPQKPVFLLPDPEISFTLAYARETDAGTEICCRYPLNKPSPLSSPRSFSPAATVTPTTAALSNLSIITSQPQDVVKPSH